MDTSEGKTLILKGHECIWSLISLRHACIINFVNHLSVAHLLQVCPKLSGQSWHLKKNTRRRKENSHQGKGCLWNSLSRLCSMETFSGLCFFYILKKVSCFFSCLSMKSHLTFHQLMGGFWVNFSFKNTKKHSYKKLHLWPSAAPQRQNCT